jgi:putative ABC transport system permease protein
MSLLRRLTGGLRGLLQKSRMERDLDAELREFFESATEQHLAAGMSLDAARRAARLQLGSAAAVKDQVRDAGWESAVESLWQDARYALRSLRKSPGFAAVAMLTLSLGIGANTAIFSVIHALLLRPLPVPQAEELVQLSIVRQDQPAAHAFSYPFVQALAARHDIFDGVFGFAAATVAVGAPGGLEQIDGAWVTAEYFDTLRLVPMLGRLLGPADDRPGAPPVVVLTEGYWRRRFGADPNVVGQTIRVYGTPAVIVGVTSPGFTGTTVGRVADLTLPLGAAPQIRPELVKMLATGANILSVMALRLVGFRARRAHRSGLASGGRNRHAECGPASRQHDGRARRCRTGRNRMERLAADVRATAAYPDGAGRLRSADGLRQPRQSPPGPHCCATT